MQQQLTQDFPEHADYIRRALSYASHVKEAGYVQIYQQKGRAWQLESSLIPEDAIKQRHFGKAVAISGEYALICDAEEGIYSYRKINQQWQQQQRISEKCNNIAMTAEWAVVSAREQAIVYKNERGFWHKTQTLLPENYLINKDKRYEYGFFANSIAIYKDTLAIGNPLGGIYRKGEPDRRGEVYMFTLNNAMWQQSAIINPQKSSYYFGKSIALTANTLFVGDTATGGGFDSLTQGSGSVFVFSKENTEWVLKEQLVPKGKPRSERFGLHVLLMDNNLLIKAFKNIYRYSL